MSSYMSPTKSSLQRKRRQTGTPIMYHTPSKENRGDNNGKSGGGIDQVVEATPTSFPKRVVSKTDIARNKQGKNNIAKLPKTVYLIRHGESLGQAAHRNGMDRKKDPRLIDAGLTQKGINQASQVPALLGEEILERIELVVSSPLTRALHTAVLAFQDSEEFLIHYHLAELGSRVPENTPRDLRKVVGDADIAISRINTSLQPTIWPPQPSDYTPPSQKVKLIQRAFQYLYNEREEEIIAVVCHFHIIQQALNDFTVRPKNACPYECHLYPNGELELK